MAVAVVDALEVVDVDERDRRSRRRAGEPCAQHLREVSAIEQLRQRVDAREPLEPSQGLRALVLGASLLRDVAHRARQHHAPVDDRHGRAIAHPARNPVHPDEAVVLLHDLAVAVDQIGEAPRDIDLRAILRMNAIVVGVDELLRVLGAPEQGGESGAVGMHDEALVGLALAAVEVLADDRGRAREGLPRGMRLGDQLGALADILDQRDA